MLLFYILSSISGLLISERLNVIVDLMSDTFNVNSIYFIIIAKKYLNR